MFCILPYCIRIWCCNIVPLLNEWSGTLSTIVSVTLLQLASSSNSCDNYNKAVFRPNRTVWKNTAFLFISSFCIRTMPVFYAHGSGKERNAQLFGKKVEPGLTFLPTQCNAIWQCTVLVNLVCASVHSSYFIFSAVGPIDCNYLVNMTWLNYNIYRSVWQCRDAWSKYCRWQSLRGISFFFILFRKDRWQTL